MPAEEQGDTNDHTTGERRAEFQIASGSSTSEATPRSDGLACAGGPGGGTE